MLRVSVVRAILNVRVSARAFDRSKPSPTAPPTPSAVAFRKVRRRIPASGVEYANASAHFPSFSRLSSGRAYRVPLAMTRIGQDTGSIEVFTFREGALSALGHDLRLRASRFDIEVLADSVTARADASSLRVVSAMRGEMPADGTLSDRDKAEIERNCAREVLEAHEHPEATFVSSAVKETEGG